jgi:flagellar biosynthetic protein FliP
METRMNPSDIEPTETASLVGISQSARLAGTTSPETVGRVRRRLVPGWHFTRHLLEMVAAMLAGMAVLGLVIRVLGEPPGYASPLVEYGLMGAFMSAPMVAWMRHRGHSWGDGLEMTAAMLLPTLALVLPIELGVAGPTGHTLMMLAHVAMIGGMVALMIYRRDRYVDGTHRNGRRER